MTRTTNAGTHRHNILQIILQFKLQVQGAGGRPHAAGEQREGERHPSVNRHIRTHGPSSVPPPRAFSCFSPPPMATDAPYELVRHPVCAPSCVACSRAPQCLTSAAAVPRFHGCWVASSPRVLQSGGIWKSVSDDRDFRYLVLDNGLRVTLVSDAKADKVRGRVRIV